MAGRRRREWPPGGADQQRPRRRGVQLAVSPLAAAHGRANGDRQEASMTASSGQPGRGLPPRRTVLLRSCRDGALIGAGAGGAYATGIGVCGGLGGGLVGGPAAALSGMATLAVVAALVAVPAGVVLGTVYRTSASGPARGRGHRGLRCSRSRPHGHRCPRREQWCAGVVQRTAGGGRAGSGAARVASATPRWLSPAGRAFRLPHPARKALPRRLARGLLARRAAPPASAEDAR